VVEKERVVRHNEKIDSKDKEYIQLMRSSKEKQERYEKQEKQRNRDKSPTIKNALGLNLNLKTISN